MTKEFSKGAIDEGGRGITLIRRLLIANLGLVALQAISAGLLMSGYGRAVAVHAAVALALQVVASIQALTAIVLWRRRRVPGTVAGLSVALFVVVFLQVAFGHQGRYWLHVPIGVGLFAGLMRQVNRLDALWRPSGAQS